MSDGLLLIHHSSFVNLIIPPALNSGCTYTWKTPYIQANPTCRRACLVVGLPVFSFLSPKFISRISHSFKKRLPGRLVEQKKRNISTRNSETERDGTGVPSRVDRAHWKEEGRNDVLLELTEDERQRRRSIIAMSFNSVIRLQISHTSLLERIVNVLQLRISHISLLERIVRCPLTTDTSTCLVLSCLH